MKTSTTITPDELATNDRVLSVISADGPYSVCQFKTGQVIDDQTYWWAVVRTQDYWPEIYTTTLEEAMAWLGRRLCETCF